MRKDGLVGLYDRLTPKERFRLFIEAQVRGDEEESRRLGESCPKGTYAIIDLAYEDRLRVSKEVTMAVCLDLAPRLTKARMFAAFCDTLAIVYNHCLDEAHCSYFEGHRAGTIAAWRIAGQDGNPPTLDEEDADNTDMERAFDEITACVEKTSKRFTNSFGDLKHRLVAEAGAMWEAFGVFSRTELGIEPEKLLKVWCEPILVEVEWLETSMANTKSDRHKLAEYRAALSAIWHEVEA